MPLLIFVCPCYPFSAVDGCAECNFHGKCILDSFGNHGCSCFRWYGGAECQINLKILLISIIVIGLVLFIMVLLCGIIVCRRKKPVVRERTGSKNKFQL